MKILSIIGGKIKLQRVSTDFAHELFPVSTLKHAPEKVKWVSSRSKTFQEELHKALYSDIPHYEIRNEPELFLFPAIDHAWKQILIDMEINLKRTLKQSYNKNKRKHK